VSTALKRTAVVGCGQISAIHIRAVHQTKYARVTCVCDVDGGRARQVAGQYGITNTYDEFSELLQEELPDVAHILTPPATHAALAIQAMRGGCDVLVEKPMALSWREAERMIAVSRETRRVLCVDHSRLFDPLVLQIQERLVRGDFGDLLAVDYYQGYAAPTRIEKSNGHSWLAQLQLGLIQDLAPHAFSFLLEFAGAPQTLHVAARPTGSAENVAPADLKVLACGERALASLTFSLSAKPFLCHATFYGTKMIGQIDFNNRTIVLQKDRKLPRLLSRVWPGVESGLQLLCSTVANTSKYLVGQSRPYPGIHELVRRFYEALRKGEEPPVTAEHGGEVVRMMDRIAELIHEEANCAP
jgi:predicted dehydrogenase